MGVVHKHLLFPAILRWRGESGMYSVLEQLRIIEAESPGRVRDRQLEKMASLLEYASRHSPFYEGKVGADGDAVLQRLRSAPILSKAQLQSEFNRLLASPMVDRTHRKTTGGSTGQPVTIVKDARAIAAERAATWLAHGWFGIDIGDRGARFWGSPQTLGRRRLRFAMADVAMNRIRLSAFGVTDDRLADYWRRCLRFRPQYLYGYVSMLERFARYLSERGLDGNSLNLKCIVTTSETLTSTQRSLLSSVFGAPVQNEYGCGEVGPVAYECERGSLHIMSQNIFVEILDERNQEVAPGVEGTVVVTDLNNRAMPLIRYRLEDRAVRGRDCECDRGFPVIGTITGRKYDFVRVPDGRSFHGEYFMYLFEDLRDDGLPIQCFRVVQTTNERLEVEIQAPADKEGAIALAVERRLSEDLGMRVDVGVVDQITLSASGKLRVIESRVDGRGDS